MKIYSVAYKTRLSVLICTVRCGTKEGFYKCNVVGESVGQRPLREKQGQEKGTRHTLVQPASLSFLGNSLFSYLRIFCSIPIHCCVQFGEDNLFLLLRGMLTEHWTCCHATSTLPMCKKCNKLATSI